MRAVSMALIALQSRNVVPARSMAIRSMWASPPCAAARRSARPRIYVELSGQHHADDTEDFRLVPDAVPVVVHRRVF
jgi:hypothetical protein